MIKVVIFDADGVLINGEKFSISLASDYGISIEKTLPFFTGPFQECLVGNADLKEAVTPYLSVWGWNEGPDAFLDYWFKVGHKIDEELVSYIQELRHKGILCFLATNNEKYRFQYMLDKMDFSKSFDKTYSSAHLGHKKPNQDFFLKIFNELDNIQKSEVLFIDDDNENVKSAKEFGIHSELYISFDNFKNSYEKNYRDLQRI